jgi:adenine C2-methylase RlmN of 23S rRNA A2503 and tRNA A37
MSALERLEEMERRIEDLLAQADVAEKEAQELREKASKLGEQMSLASQIKKEMEEKLEEERQTVKSLAESFREKLTEEDRKDFDAIMQCSGIEYEEDQGRTEDTEGISPELAQTA